MSALRKPFRVERFTGTKDAKPIAIPQANNGAGNGAGYAEVMKELSAIKAMVANGTDAAPQTVAVDLQKTLLDELKAEMAQVAPLKKELDEIYDSISKTKREIASLHVSGFEGDDMNRVTDELDAVVNGTETATEKILSAAEVIDDRAGTLSAMLNRDDQGLAVDIQDQVVQIFESCNFQDLTGQRITKVVNTLRFIEDRIMRMMEIWGGIEGFKDVEIVDELRREGDDALLNGPALDGQADVASQDDIDALFN